MLFEFITVNRYLFVHVELNTLPSLSMFLLLFSVIVVCYASNTTNCSPEVGTYNIILKAQRNKAQRSFQPVKAQRKMRKLFFLLSEAQRNFRNELFDSVEAQRNSAIAEQLYQVKAQCNFRNQNFANTAFFAILD